MALAALHWAEAGALLCECLAAQLAAAPPAAHAAPTAEEPPGPPRGWPAAAACAGAPAREGRAHAPDLEPGPPPMDGGGAAHPKRRRVASADDGQVPPGKRLDAGAGRGTSGAATPGESGEARQDRGCGGAVAWGGAPHAAPLCGGGVGGGLGGAEGLAHGQAPAVSGATKAMPVQPPGFAHALQAAWSELVSGLAGSGPCSGSPRGDPPSDQAACKEDGALVWLPGDVCCLGRRAGFLSLHPAERAPGAQQARAALVDMPTQQAIGWPAGLLAP